MEYPDYTQGSDQSYHEMLGYKVVEWEEGRVRLEMDVRDRHRNNFGDYTHGGILMGLLDISALLSGIHDKRGTVDVLTLSLTTNFIAAPHSERVAAEGELIHIGRSTFFARSKVMDIASGQLLATGDGVFRIRAKKT
jgi:uncharacterized protein (TIGR00369 family)|tara:strand:+ start:116 stop:526 length:411 start_codon:yes stop_codon:yes gene_type:complete